MRLLRILDRNRSAVQPTVRSIMDLAIVALSHLQSISNCLKPLIPRLLKKRSPSVIAVSARGCVNQLSLQNPIRIGTLGLRGGLPCIIRTLIQSQGGYIWIYPKRDQAVFQGDENMRFYSMGAHLYRKGFCKTCGVHFNNFLSPLSDKQLAALPEAQRNLFESQYEVMAINARVFNDDDVAILTPRWDDGYDDLAPAYVNP